MYINILFQLASSPLKGFYCCKSKRNLSVRAKQETRIRKLGRFQGFRVSALEGAEIQNPLKQATFEVSGS